MVEIYIAGNYLIISERIQGQKVKTYEFAMRWTTYRFNNTTGSLEINEFTGGKYIFTAAMLDREQVVDENKNPYTLDSLTEFLRNYTAQ